MNYEDFDSGDLMGRSSICTAKQVADHYEKLERIRASNAAREARSHAATEAQIHSAKSLAALPEQLEAIKAFNEARELASREREKIEMLQYRETRRLSIIAIMVAVASVAIAIFK